MIGTRRAADAWPARVAHRLPLPLALVAIVYTVDTVFAYAMGDLWQFHLTDDGLWLGSWEASIALNRAAYTTLCVLLWGAALSIRVRPRTAAALLACTLPILFGDGGGTFFDLFVNILHVATDGDGFERYYSGLRVHTRLWQMSVGLVVAGIVVGWLVPPRMRLPSPAD